MGRKPDYSHLSERARTKTLQHRARLVKKITIGTFTGGGFHLCFAFTKGKRGPLDVTISTMEDDGSGFFQYESSVVLALTKEDMEADPRLTEISLTGRLGNVEAALYLINHYWDRKE